MGRQARSAANFVTYALTLFSFLVNPCVFGADPKTDGKPKVSVFVPTNRANPADGRADALRMEFADVDLSEVGDILHKSNAVLPEFDAAHPPVVPFYMSRMRPPEEQAAMLQEARAQLKKQWPNFEPRFQVRYLEEEHVDVESLSRHLDLKIDEIARGLPETEETRREVAALHDANRAALVKTLEAAKKKEGLFAKPSLMRKVIKGIAGAKAVLNFGARTGQVIEGGYQGFPQLLAGIGMMAAAPALEYFGTVYETELAERFSGHQLPFINKSERPILKKINEFYTHNKVAQFVKGATGNAMLWGVADPLFMQMLGNLNNPGGVPHVTWENAGINAATSFPSAFLYMGGYLGMENMRQKGWMTGPALDLALRVTGVLWQSAEFVLSTGNPLFQKVALPIILGPLWTGLAGATLISMFLPANNKRIVLVDEALRNRDDIDALEALESTKKVPKGGLAQAVREVAELGVVPRRGFLPRLFGSFCKSAFGLFAKSAGPPAPR